MAKKFLGKVVAGAALGGAALLVGAPAAALADAGPSHDSDSNHVFTDPRWVKPGQRVTIGEVCSDEQKDPHVWSKATGKLKLHEVPSYGSHDGQQYGEDGKSSEEGDGSWTG